MLYLYAISKMENVVLTNNKDFNVQSEYICVNRKECIISSCTMQIQQSNIQNNKTFIFTKFCNHLIYN